MAIQKEGAAHRRQRRRRTYARHLLRNWLGGHVGYRRQAVVGACLVLETHHSKSTLPSRARRQLQSRLPAMQRNTGWWCENCRRNVKQSANYCPACGGAWQTCAAQPSYTGRPPSVPWRGQRWEDEPRSPRWRLPQSPRRRKGGEKGAKGNKDKDAKGKGKGKSGGEDSAKKPPTVEQLPPGPPTPAISQPKSIPGSDPGPSQDKAQLDTLLGILAASSSTLPPAAQQMIATIQENSVSSATKAKHKAVAEQARAQQALAKTQAQRTAYLQAWQQYITQLASLLEGQIQEQTAILEDFDQAELAWTQTEHAATQQLAKLTNDVRESESAEKDAEEADQAVDMAIEQEQKLKAASEESQHAAKRMLHALTDMRNTAAEQLQKASRDGSRTPRRQADSSGGKDEKTAPDDKAEPKAKAGQGLRVFGQQPPGGAHA